MRHQYLKCFSILLRFEPRSHFHSVAVCFLLSNSALLRASRLLLVWFPLNRDLEVVDWGRLTSLNHKTGFRIWTWFWHHIQVSICCIHFFSWTKLCFCDLMFNSSFILPLRGVLLERHKIGANFAYANSSLRPCRDFLKLRLLSIRQDYKRGEGG